MVSVKNITALNIDLSYLKKIKKDNYVFGKWVFLSNTLQNINSNFYLFISAMLLPLSAIGALNSAKTLIGLATVVFLALDNYLIPKYAKRYMDYGREAIEREILPVFIRIGSILIFMYSLVAFFPNELMGFIFGENFAQYGYFLYYFLISSLLMFCTRPILILAKTIGETKVMYQAALPTLLFVLIVSYGVINFYGVDGALSIMLLAQLIYLASLIYFYKGVRYANS